MCTFAARYHGEHWLGCPLLVSHEAESDACKCAALSHEVSERSLQLHPVQASPALPVLRCAKSADCCRCVGFWADATASSTR